MGHISQSSDFLKIMKSHEPDHVMHGRKKLPMAELKRVKAQLEIYCCGEAQIELGSAIRFTSKELCGEKFWHAYPSRPQLFGLCVSYLRSIGELPLRRAGKRGNTILYSFLPIQPMTGKETSHAHRQA